MVQNALWFQWLRDTRPPTFLLARWADLAPIFGPRPTAASRWRSKWATVAALGLFVLLGGQTRLAISQTVFPGSEWAKADAAAQGWSDQRLKLAEALMRELGSTGVMIVQHGQVIASWGDTARRVRVASVRKSFLSALFGIAQAEGKINLNATLADLGIDDKPPRLTTQEKTASVRDLLQARSGVYHEATAETDQQLADRPVRGSHLPGNFWYYNNWDFNALGTIYRQATGEDIFEAFERRVGKPIGMQEFTAADGRYVLRRSSSSTHPAYHMDMSARDLARFGLLFLNKGRWGKRQVVPESWIAESTSAYSITSRKVGYGYMWWVSAGDQHFGIRFGNGTYSARGYGGQLIIVSPSNNLIITHLTEGYIPERKYRELLARIFAAAPATP